VLQAPMIVSIWDDNYGISVPNEFQMTKGHISELLKGFQRDPKQKQGYDIYTVKGWDYPSLCETYIHAAAIVRMEHVPAVLHVIEVTQPQGHSTSGSQERYKSKERLDWEAEFDCIKKMREWMMAQGIASADELDRLERDDIRIVRVAAPRVGSLPRSDRCRRQASERVSRSVRRRGYEERAAENSGAVSPRCDARSCRCSDRESRPRRHRGVVSPAGACERRAL
jgi:TPP-dependent pyruvate/acetoin dehydrogenase alpha subunit